MATGFSNWYLNWTKVLDFPGFHCSYFVFPQIQHDFEILVQIPPNIHKFFPLAAMTPLPVTLNIESRINLNLHVLWLPLCKFFRSWSLQIISNLYAIRYLQEVVVCCFHPFLPNELSPNLFYVLLRTKNKSCFLILSQTWLKGIILWFVGFSAYNNRYHENIKTGRKETLPFIEKYEIKKSENRHFVLGICDCCCLCRVFFGFMFVVMWYVPLTVRIYVACVKWAMCHFECFERTWIN